MPRVTQPPSPEARSILGGSWAVISGVISPLIWVITIVILLIILLITTHEPPSRSLLRTSSCAEKDLGLEMPKP